MVLNVGPYSYYVQLDGPKSRVCMVLEYGDPKFMTEYVDQLRNLQLTVFP